MAEFMHVIHMEFKNFKGVEELNLTLNEAHCYLIGGNGQGKTSICDFIFTLLSKRLKDKLTNSVPGEMIRRGADRMEGYIDLGRNGEVKYKVKVAMSRKGGTLDIKVFNDKGQKLSPSRRILDELVGVIDFDIQGFLNLAPKEKVKFMKEWTGIDFSDLEDALKTANAERRHWQDEVTRLEAELTPLLPFNPKQLTPKTLDDINQKRSDLLARQERYDDFKERVQDIEVQMGWDEKELADTDTEIEQLRQRIAQLEKKKLALGDKLLADHTKLQTGKEYLKNTPRPDISELDHEYADMMAYNEQVSRNVKAVDLNQRVVEADAKHLAKVQEVKDIELALKAEVAAAKLPVPGLSFDENGLYLNGLPFESSQINTAEMVIAAIQLQLPLMREVGVARFDASLLDKNNRERVEAWANSHDIQLFQEEVDRVNVQEGVRFVLKDRDTGSEMAIAS